MQPSFTIPAGRYRHYKGREYEVLGMALHSETLEEMVVYKPLYEIPDIAPGTLWVRPAAMFLETVITEQGEVPRFTAVNP
ncbi:MAG: DUF1653 domain-containing protein [Bacteroidetes bacterium]|nr:DUF1653 domain-containing protein [Bacteroidota bacterium]